MEKYINIDRDTPMLLPPDLREWIAGDDMVHFVIDAIEGMKINGFKVNHRGTGSAQYPPRMMLALLIYCYADGIFGSRRIERATYRDIAVRYLTGNTHPDHDTIAKFRRENFEAVAECFVRVLELAREMKLLRVGTVSIDGTKLKANASKHKNVGYERAGQLLEQLDIEVRDLMQKAEEADGREEGAEQGLPEELARREKLKSKLQEARGRLEERAKARAQAEREEYERKRTDRDGRSGSSKGKKIKPPQEEPRPDEQANLVDADSRLMRKSKREGYEQAYNSQAVVDADGSQLVLAARVTQCASDSNELVANVKMVSESIGKVAVVLADSGYANGAEVDQLQQRSAKDKIEVYVAVSAEDRRRYDYRPERKEDKPVKNICTPWKLQMKEKIETETGRALYSRRKQTVEPVFGVIKAAMGFRQFLLRGLDKVRGEWQLVTMAYNFKRLWNLKILAERG
ncbi:MAG: IS1182 family transposase [Nitrospirota bacterium]|nr:IS1182 family transposase [Nitrospirota bacterium]